MRQAALNIMQMPAQKSQSILSSLMGLGAAFAPDPGLKAGLTAGSALLGGNSQGAAQGIAQAINQPQQGTPPTQPVQNGMQPPPVQTPAAPEKPQQPSGGAPGTTDGGGGSQGQQGGGSGSAGDQTGGIALPKPPTPVPDPMAAGAEQQQKMAIQQFLTDNPDMFTTLQQNPHFLDGLLGALGGLKQHLSSGQGGAVA